MVIACFAPEEQDVYSMMALKSFFAPSGAKCFYAK
jgi:hypothetical protein